MGFRFIKKHLSDSGEQRQSLKRQALTREAIRWMNLTQHSVSECQDFIHHFEEVLNKSHCDDHQISDLREKIKGKHPGLESIQGNLNLSHIEDLLNGLDLRRPNS